MDESMTLAIYLPYQLLLKIERVKFISYETETGSQGLLPNRLDCVSALVPSILTFRTDLEEVYVAIDEGILIKADNKVTISTRNGFSSSDLGQLQALVEETYLQQNDKETRVKKVIDKLESEFLKRYVETRHGK